MTALAEVRRADWRFLLPEPSLGVVAYLAPHERALSQALRLVSRRVDLLAAPATRATHDLVVLTAGRPGSVRGARRLLRPGGWLYAEVPGPAVRAWIRMLRRSGFDEVTAHWLWPTARSCREIVPLEREALHLALARRDPGARLAVRVRAARLLVRAGAFPLAIRRAAVVGRWP
jgi:hypothetical protein